MGSAVSGVMSLAQGSPGVPQANEQQQISNAQDTYKTATADSAQTMNTATALNGQSQAALSTAMGQENPMVSGVNNAATSSLNNYGSTFSPLQAQQAQMAQNYTSDANTQLRQGQAVADQNSGTQAALQNQRASLASEGVDPASVHGSALTQQAALTGAANAAGAATNSALQTQATGNQLINQANTLGTQVGALGASQASTGSGIAAQNVANTNNTNNSNVNNLTAANTYLNSATGANNSATTAANDQFNQQQTGYQDQVAAQAAQASAVGGIASGAMSFMQAGGVVPSGIPALVGGGPITSRGALPQPIVPGTTDNKLIAATPGEFMLPKDVSEFMGHDKLHRLIDSTRQKIAERHGIPMHAQLSSAHTSTGA